MLLESAIKIQFPLTFWRFCSQFVDSAYTCGLSDSSVLQYIYYVLFVDSSKISSFWSYFERYSVLAVFFEKSKTEQSIKEN